MYNIVTDFLSVNISVEILQKVKKDGLIYWYSKYLSGTLW